MNLGADDYLTKPVKKHMSNIFNKMGLEGRNAAIVRALEALSVRKSPH